MSSQRLEVANLPIYFDYMATTPVDSRVARKMADYLTMDGCFGNSASNHVYGWAAAEAVQIARLQVAALINADSREIVWTSGATESDNLAIIGAARFYQRKGKHIISCKTEHKAVLDSCKQLEREGFQVTYLTAPKNGLIDINEFQAAIRSDTILASIMHVNNEIGVIQDIQSFGKICRERGIVFHVDAAQSAGKLPIDVRQLPVDLMSFSAHKVYGPKGIGALYVCRTPRIRLEPLIHGGGHENGLRSGTLATHQIVGMGEAFALANECMPAEAKRLTALRDQLWAGIQQLNAVYLNGDAIQRSPGNLNISFAGVEGDSLLLALKDLAVSTASACSSASIEPSYVLRAIGVGEQLAHSSLRFSIGRFTTEENIQFAIDTIVQQVRRLRQISV